MRIRAATKRPKSRFDPNSRRTRASRITELPLSCRPARDRWSPTDHLSTAFPHKGVEQRFRAIDRWTHQRLPLVRRAQRHRRSGNDPAEESKHDQADPQRRRRCHVRRVGLEHGPDPVPGPAELLVATEAAPINRATSCSRPASTPSNLGCRSRLAPRASDECWPSGPAPTRVWWVGVC